MKTPEYNDEKKLEQTEMNRRDWLKWAGLAGMVVLTGCKGSAAIKSSSTPAKPSLAVKDKGIVTVASTGSPREMVINALKPLGGIEKFVKKGTFVVIKPNIGWQRTPEQAANTNPEVVATVVELCKKAGASRVLVIEHTCDEPSQLVFDISGIEKAVKAAGGEIIAANQEGMYEDIQIPMGKALKSAKVISEIRRADCFINIPVAKDHGSAKLTIGMKNMMGTVWDRGNWHRSGLHQSIADYSTVIRADLTIVDAIKIMTAGGPKGPGPLKNTNQILASVDPVAIDAYTTTLFDLKPEDIDYIMKAKDHGLGEADLKLIKVVKA
jgi:uncharacterized protein (DUF362 family)